MFFLSPRTLFQCAILSLLVASYSSAGEETEAGSTWEHISGGIVDRGRDEFGFVELNDKFYIIGGANKIMPTLEYDPQTEKWRQLKTPPPSNFSHLQAVVYQDRIYIVSAWEGFWPDESNVSHVWSFDPDGNDSEGEWRRELEIPEARRRGSAGVVLHDDKFYIAGGLSNGHSAREGGSRQFDVYDPQANGGLGSWRALGDTPRTRDHFHAALVGNYIYLIGGRNNRWTGKGEFADIVTEIDVYDIAQEVWLDQDIPPMPTPRSGTAVAVHNEYVYVLGGVGNSRDSEFSTVEYLDTQKNQWHTGASMLAARSGAQAVLYKNAILVFGGGVQHAGQNRIESVPIDGLTTPVQVQTETQPETSPASGLISGTGASLHAVGGEFHKEILADGLQNPVDLTISDSGKIFIVERQGRVILIDPDSPVARSVLDIDVFFEFEDGLLAMALAPDFDTSGNLYLYYSPPEKSVNRLSRFNYFDGSIQADSEIIVLEVAVQRDECCHAAGDMVFDSAGNLLLATGDNAFHSLLGAVDEAVGYKSAEGSSANTMDLRGKILRITPQPDGSYSVPPGNLFSGQGNGRPEIYVMGARSPFKLSLDPQTQWLFWADVGPDARKPDGRNPIGLDEINLTKGSGNYGWPYFIGDNQGYWDENRNTAHEAASPSNQSRWNTGTQALPPAQAAWISKPAQCLLAGPVYRYDDNVASDGKLPREFDGSLIYFDFNKSKILAAWFDSLGTFESSQRIAPYLGGNGFIDVQLGPDHHLYVLEYGFACCPLESGKGKLSRLDFRPLEEKYAHGWDAHELNAPLVPEAGSLHTVDINKDGFTDIVAGGNWFENPGKPDGNWVQHSLGSNLTSILALADFNRDGKIDLFGLQSAPGGSKMVWAANHGNGTFAVHDTIPGKKSFVEPGLLAGVVPGDFLSNSYPQLAMAWQESELAPSRVEMLIPSPAPAREPWSSHLIFPISGGFALHSADVDADGDLDLGQGLIWLENLDGYKWWKNPVSFERKATGSSAMADLDGDGLVDVLQGFLQPDAPLVWYKNRNASKNNWEPHEILNVNGGDPGLELADFDYDGDIDIAMGERHGRQRMILLENDGSGETWFPQLIHDGSSGTDYRDTASGDLDNDGDIDLIIMGGKPARLLILENRSSAQR